MPTPTKLGAACPKCKFFIPAGLWGAAHTGMTLLATCPKCKHQFETVLR